MGFAVLFVLGRSRCVLDREIAEIIDGARLLWGPAESPYARDDDEVLALRRRMLEAWARHCAGESAEVIAFPNAHP